MRSLVPSVMNSGTTLMHLLSVNSWDSPHMVSSNLFLCLPFFVVE